MKHRTGFYSFILTSMVCILGGVANAAPAVRMLGTNSGKTVTGAVDAATGATTGTTTTGGVSTTAVATRASSLRFTPNAANNVVSTQSGATMPANNSGASGGVVVNNSASPSARLSIGKYLNLSHTTGAVTPGGTSGGGTSGGTGGGASNADVDALRAELDNLQTQVDKLNDDKQNSLIVTDDEYIDIGGPDNNIISIDIGALKNDLQSALDTRDPILTEIDAESKLWWCYADSTGSACDGTRQLVVDLGDVLDTYDLATKNVSLAEALAGKQGILDEADNGFITVNQSAGTIGIKFDELKTALGIDDAKTSEIRYDAANGKLQWRYMDEFEQNGDKKWNTADIAALINQSLENYVQIQMLDDYVQKSQLTGLQATLTASDNGYLEIDNNQIGVKFDELKAALDIPTERAVEIEFDDAGKIQWRYAGDDTWNKTNRKVSDFVDLSAYVLRSELAGLQGALTASDNGYLKIENNQIGIKFDDLKAALEIPAAQQDIEMEITSTGQLRWRYLNAFENDGETKKWTVVSENINDLIDTKLANYVTLGALNDYQLKLSSDANGYLVIDGNTINLNFNKLKTDLQIPNTRDEIEMEITNGGMLRWRYLDEFESDGETKKWTNVNVAIGDLIDGKLANYISNTRLTEILNNYVTQNDLSGYTTKTYVDNALATKQVKLTEAENGFIEIKPIDGTDGETIGIKFEELKNALNIPDAKTSEMRVDNGVIQWRYLDEFEVDADTGEKTDIKKWTTVYDLNSLLGDWVAKSDFNAAINRIDTELAGKQIKLTPAVDGYILLNEQTGEIAVDMVSLRNELAVQAGVARTAELRVFDGKLQWRYTDEYTTDGVDNREEVWHDLDLTAVRLPLYVEKNYLTNNYYSRTYIDNLARTIENNINTTLERLSLPDGPEAGLYMLSVTGSGDNKVSRWSPIQIVDGDGVVQNMSLNDADDDD